MEKKVLKLGLPKGSLQESTYALMSKAGFKVTGTKRSYLPKIDDEELEIVLIRAQEMGRYVEQGAIDAGITGFDWISECGAQVQEISDLIYAKQGMRPVRWVLAVPETSPIQSVKDLEGKKIATEVVGITNQYLEKNGVSASVEFSWGATEIKPPRLADAIVELTETGSSLRANHLRIVETVLESTTRLVMNKEAYKDDWKRQKVEGIATLIQGALKADKMAGLKMNVHKSNKDNLLQNIPSMKKPTLSVLTDDDWYSVETVMEEKEIRRIIPELKRLGAEDIIEYPLNKVID